MVSEADDAAAAVGARLKVVVALTVYPTGPPIHIFEDILWYNTCLLSLFTTPWIQQPLHQPAVVMLS